MPPNSLSTREWLIAECWPTHGPPGALAKCPLAHRATIARGSRAADTVFMGGGSAVGAVHGTISSSCSPPCGGGTQKPLPAVTMPEGAFWLVRIVPQIMPR